MRYSDLTVEQIQDMVQVRLLTDAEIAHELNCSISTITRFKSVNNIHKLFHNREWLEREYKSGKLISEIATELRTNRENIRLYLRKFGIDTNFELARQSTKKYHFNERIFQKINTQEKAYWLGFITADGCVEEIKRIRKVDNVPYYNYRLRFTIGRSDRKHLEKFKNFIGDNNIPIIDHTHKLPGRDKTYYTSHMKVCCRQMCVDLMNQGIIPRKSMHEQVPQIEDRLIPHFIRGEFDGDGCIDCCGRVTIVGSLALMEWIKDVSGYGVVHHNKRDHKNLWTYSIWSREDSHNFLKWIYKQQRVCLDRKFERYQNIYCSI